VGRVVASSSALLLLKVMDSNSYPAGQSSKLPSRRPDVKRKLVVVGDGTFCFVSEGCSFLQVFRSHLFNKAAVARRVS
jgi:hypothetical protein